MTLSPRPSLIIFLSSQVADYDAAVKKLMPKVELDTVYLAQRAVYDEWREALQRVRGDLEIVSLPTAVAAMARLAVEALDARGEGGE